MLGADGSTKTQLGKGMGLPESFDFKPFVNDSTALLQMSNVSLNIANGMFVTKRLSDTDRFRDKLKEVFQSELHKIKVADSSESADTINRYKLRIELSQSCSL